MFKKRELSLIIFYLSVVILSGLACVSPWWEASTAKESEILKGIQLKVEYRPEGTVSAYNLSVSSQITALEIRGKTKVDNVTINLKIEKSWIRIPTKLGLGKFYSTFNGSVDVKRNEQEYSMNFNGRVKVDNIVFSMNFTYNTEEALELEGGIYPVLCELELRTKPTTIPLTELDSNEEAKYELKSFLAVIWILNLVSLGFNVTVLGLMFLYMITRKNMFYRFLRCLSIIATIIPLISFSLFAEKIQGLISKLNNVVPPEIYTLKGSDVKALFGRVNDVVYGPSLGWKMTFVIFIMNAALFMLVSKIRKVEASVKS